MKKILGRVLQLLGALMIAGAIYIRLPSFLGEPVVLHGQLVDYFGAFAVFGGYVVTILACLPGILVWAAGAVLIDRRTSSGACARHKEPPGPRGS